MVESSFGVSIFILLFGVTILSIVAYHNCYLPKDQKVKAQYLIEKSKSGIEPDYYDDSVVRYRYRIGKDKIKFLSMMIALFAAAGLVASNIVDAFLFIRGTGWLGIMITLVTLIISWLIVWFVHVCIYSFVMRYEKMGAKNMYDIYFRDGAILIEEKKDKLFEQIIESRH